MNTSYLTSASMITIGKDLLTNPKRLTLMERDALTAALIPRIHSAHTTLIVLSKSDGELLARQQEVSIELAACDQVHDRGTRGLYRGLETAADIVDTPEKARPFVDARDVLLPDGLSINVLPYREEAGNTVKVAQRATEPIRAVLRRVVVDGYSLEDTLDAWIANGKRMSVLVAERATLMGDDDDTRVSAGDLRHARQEWIRAINLLLATLDVIDMPPEDRRYLLANLQDAESRATKARAAEQRRRAGSQPGEPVTGEDDVLVSPTPVSDEPAPVVDTPVVDTPVVDTPVIVGGVDEPVIDGEVEDRV